MHQLATYISLRTLLVSPLPLSLFQPAFSWGVTGHRTSAEIAQQHLTKKAKKELRKLIGKGTLALWSNWPDFIKSDSTWNHASHWHYVDLPGHMEKEKFIEDLKKLPGKICIPKYPR